MESSIEQVDLNISMVIRHILAQDGSADNFKENHGKKLIDMLGKQ